MVNNFHYLWIFEATKLPWATAVTGVSVGTGGNKNKFRNLKQSISLLKQGQEARRWAAKQLRSDRTKGGLKGEAAARHNKAEFTRLFNRAPECTQVVAKSPE
jgi:hypothetical protein